MYKTQKIILGIALVAMVGFLSACDLNSTSQSEKPIVKIGVILPLIGSQANLGESAKNSVLLAQEKLGKTKFNYQVIFEDDAMDPKLTSNAASKLINIDKVNAIISFTSGPGNVVTPLATENKIIHTGVASDPNIAKGEYNFLHWTTPQEENRVWVQEAIKRGIKSFAIIGANQQGVLATIADVKNQIVGKDLKLVDEELFNMGTKDYKVIIEKVKEKNPDIVLLEMFSPDLEILTKQYKELGVEIPLTSIESFEYADQPSLFEGLWYVQSAQASDELSNEFQKRFNINLNVGSPYVYDNLNLIVAAYERAEEINNAEAASELSQIKDFSSAVGKISVGDEGIVWSEAVVREIKNGKFVTIK